MKKRSVLRCCALFFCFAFLLGGCTGVQPDSHSQSEADSSLIKPQQIDFVLPFTESDGYNPYLNNSNLTLMAADLLFDKLTVITPGMEMEYGVLSSCTINGLTVTLHTAGGLYFADGSAVSPADIAASLEAARQSEAYKARFANIQEISHEAGGTVVITLAEPDCLFAYLLDIPVLKASETAASQPTASGRYTYGEDNTFVKNPYHQGEVPYERIRRYRLTGYDALAGNLSLGNISLYASELETETTGASSLRQSYYKMNNLVFIGVNGAHLSEEALKNTAADFLKQPIGRRALSRMIDRQLLVEKVYYSRGYAATGLLNSAYPDMLALQTDILGTAQLDEARADIQSLGYSMKLDGYYYNDKDERLSLRLLYYSGSAHKRYLAELLQNQFDAVGIELILVESDDFEGDYRQKIISGDFDLYIGEVKLYNNMDMSPFFAENGALRGKLDVSEELTEKYAAFRASAPAAKELEQAFALQMPFVPLLWRSGAVYSSKALPALTPSISDIFYGFDKLIAEKE